MAADVATATFEMTLTSSVSLPTQTMPGWLQAFAEHLPITIAIIASALRARTDDAGNEHPTHDH